VVLLLAALIQLVPFYVAVTTAFKPVTDLSSQLVPPHELFLGNFLTALNQGNILRAVGNSILITVISTVLVCLLGAMAAYPLARRLTAVNKTVSLVIVGLIMVPPLSILVPLYTMMNQLHAINSYWGVIAVMVTGHLPLAIFLYSAFMRSLPLSIEEAATVDGANMLQILFRIIFPVLKPVTATVIILSGVSIWNEFSLSGYLLAKPSVQTIAPAIGSFFSQQSSNLGAAAAASLIAVIPVLVAYLFLQKYFIKGMVAGAEK
jgi:raffinose/stachyose/melibiose transport system permease protein